MSDPKPATPRQAALERVSQADAELKHALDAVGAAAKDWGAKQHAADLAFAEFLRLQGELAIKRYGQQMARLALISTPETVPADPSRPGWQA